MVCECFRDALFVCQKSEKEKNNETEHFGKGRCRRMRARERTEVGVKLLKTEQACQRYSMCRNSLVSSKTAAATSASKAENAQSAAEDAQAVVRYGRSVFFNATKLDAYFDGLSTQ